MINCQKLWSIWFITYLIVINIYLTVVSIKDYLNFKYEIFDLAYGGNWNMSSIYLILGCINASLALFPIIIYTFIVPQKNLANDGHILGRDPDVFYLTVNEHGKGRIIPMLRKKQICFKNLTFLLIYLELPPISYLLHLISAMCFLIPKAFIEGQRIKQGVLKSNLIWHSDLDFLFGPDQQHSDFVHDRVDYVQPVTIAYFNLGLSLVLLSLQYSRVLWHISRRFTVLLSFLMMLWSVHLLIEHCTVSILIKISLNPLAVSDQLRISVNPFVIQFLSIGSNAILLFSFTTMFHYGVLQYADSMIYMNRRGRRQMMNSSPQIIGSNHLDMGSPFSTSVSDNNYSEGSMEPVFSGRHLTHVLAILCLCASTSLKTTYIYQSFVCLYQTTSDSITLTNALVSGFYVVVWLILWFALTLRRNWNFRIIADQKYNIEAPFLNVNSVTNHQGTMQLRQLQNSLLRNPKSSDINLSKQDMMALNRNVGLDGCSDDTDMSSKLSSNNYVFLQSMRNGQLNLPDSNGQTPMRRNPVYLSYAMNNQGPQNNNTVYANEDLVNNRSVQIDDQMGSEHSYNSNMSRNMGFENLPPILPNFDENRYKHLNPAAVEKLQTRYLRHQSLDYNNFVHFPLSNEYSLPPLMTPTIPYDYDNNTQNFRNNNNNSMFRYKSAAQGNQTRPLDRYSTLQTASKSSSESMDFIIQTSDEDMQRRSLYSNDCSMKDGVFDQRRGVKSPVMFPTLEESVTDNVATESEFLLPRYSNELGTNTQARDPDPSDQSKDLSHIKESLPDRMCSQV